LSTSTPFLTHTLQGFLQGEHVNVNDMCICMFMFMFMCTFIFMFIFTFMVMPMSMSMSISCTGAFTVQVNVPEVDAGAFFRFCTHERESKKERKSVEKKEFEKSESAKEKSELCFFLPQTLQTQSRAQSHSAGGKARVLSKMYSTVC
jgi:hypothetical protein